MTQSVLGGPPDPGCYNGDVFSTSRLFSCSPASPPRGRTVFPANALGLQRHDRVPATNLGTQGSVIYSSTTTVGELGLWDRATNQHTDLGNITSSGYTNPYAGNAPADAAYWDGGYGVAAGYYIVDSSRNVYRVDLTATTITR